MIPFQFFMFTLGAIICSGVLYNDFAGMPSVDVFLFCVGCGLTFLGVYCITQGRARKPTGHDTIQSLAVRTHHRALSLLTHAVLHRSPSA